MSWVIFETEELNVPTAGLPKQYMTCYSASLCVASLWQEALDRKVRVEMGGRVKMVGNREILQALVSRAQCSVNQSPSLSQLL